MSRLQIQFRLGSIPVRIEPGFWLMTLVLGSSMGTGVGLALWCVIELVGVLTHELGHALAAKAFGARPEITLYTMGGLTRYAVPRDRPYGRFQSMSVSFAGPAAGFLLAALAVVAAMAFMVPGGSLVERAVALQALVHNRGSGGAVGLALWLMLLINVGWGLINLLPILPLDGGNILRAALGGRTPESGLVRALWVSSVLGPAVTFVTFKAGLLWASMLFGYFSYSSIRQLIDARRLAADRRAGLHARIEDAQRALEEGELERASMQATAAMNLAASPAVRSTAIHLLAVAKLELGDARAALDVLRNLPDSETDAFLLGACLLAAGRAEDALPHLEKAAVSGSHPQAQAMLDQARRVALAWKPTPNHDQTPPSADT